MISLCDLKSQGGTIGRPDWPLLQSLSFGLTPQRGGHTVHNEYANKGKAKKNQKLIHHHRRAHHLGAGNAGMAVESGSVDISRLSGVKADESRLA